MPLKNRIDRITKKLQRIPDNTVYMFYHLIYSLKENDTSALLELKGPILFYDRIERLARIYREYLKAGPNDKEKAEYKEDYNTKTFDEQTGLRVAGLYVYLTVWEK